MEDVLTTVPRNGQPRSEASAAFMARYEPVMRVPIIVSAILPLIVMPSSKGWFSILVGITTWLVFVVDYAVRMRHLEHYRQTAYGRFDLFVVIATAPWFLLPGAATGRFVVLLRLARLGRLIVATKGSRRLFERLGRVAIVAVGIVIAGSLVAYFAEHPTNPEFATFGDALWWGVVTLTTVGYGDIVPKTPTGRWAAVCIMFTGVAVLGLLAGSLASFFRIAPTEDVKPGPDGPVSNAGQTALPATGDMAPTSVEAALLALTREVAALRNQVQELTGRVTDKD